MTPNTAALIPLIDWPATSSQGPGNTASSSPRIGNAAQPNSISGRRPICVAARPTQGDSMATTPCGTRMQAAMIMLA